MQLKKRVQVQNVQAINYGDSLTNTIEIGGSRFPTWDQGGLTPQGYGPILNNATYALPSVPPTYGDVSGTGAIPQPNAGNSSALAAGTAPFSLKQSPLVWAVIGVIGGLYAIHHVAWKGE